MFNVFANTVKDSYKNGRCPDCLLEIPDDVEEGQGCVNCEHVFNEELPCLREWDGHATTSKFESGWQCCNDHTGCFWNDGNNTCTHWHESSLNPLEDPSIQEAEETA